jgi:hypothetical protein
MANENEEGKQTSWSRMVRTAKVCIDSFHYKSSLQHRPSHRLGERKQHYSKGEFLIMAFENAFTGRLVLFNNQQKKSDKSPDMSGSVEFSLQDAMALADWITGQGGEENYKGEKVIKVPVSAWHTQSKNGTGFISGQMAAQKIQTEVDEIPF